jgi:ribosome-binding protein aMBF1 (putative translation factor)
LDQKQEWEGREAMREKDRRLARKRLDVEMRSYRRSRIDENAPRELLRAVRLALGVPVSELARKLGVDRSVLFDLERRERRGTIMLRSLERVAGALGCKLVYGIVPQGRKTFEAYAEDRLWRGVLGMGKQGVEREMRG